MSSTGMFQTIRNIRNYNKDPKELIEKLSTAFANTKKPDYVLVYSKKEVAQFKFRMDLLSTYLNNIKQSGLTVQEENGLELTNLTCIKVFASNAVLAKYATEFNIELTKNNPHYKYPTSTYLNSMSNIATSPYVEHPVVQRALGTLSGDRPTDYTTAERILIVDKLLSTISHGVAIGDNGFQKLISRKVLIAAYPLHDSPYEWTDEGPLSDRQNIVDMLMGSLGLSCVSSCYKYMGVIYGIGKLLARYWANITCIFKEQPLTLVERYYGPEMGYYFAWLGCYTKMLLLPAIFSAIFFVIGLVYYFAHKDIIEREVCHADMLLCPVCPSYHWCTFNELKYGCYLMRFSSVLENPFTVVYSILMSFWGIVFVVFWRRKQAILRVRWNHTAISGDRSMRLGFVKAATCKGRSSVTGEDVYYIPFFSKVSRIFVSYLGVLFMLLLYIAGIILVMLYRWNVMYYGLESGNETFKHRLDLFNTLSASFISSIIMMILDGFGDVLSRKLTEVENPRTQDSFNKLYTIKLTIFALGNIFFPMIYLGFIKGHLYTHPGDPTQWTLIGLFKSDTCAVSGCLMDVSVQLAALMFTRNVIKMLVEILGLLLKLIVARYKADWLPERNQWEDEFTLIQPSRTILHAEYMQMVVQYGFMTFFVVALPVAPFFAFVNNIFELRFDAMKFHKNYRRIIPKQVTGIEEWNGIIQVMTVLGAISNPLLIAFGSHMIPKYIYRSAHDNSLEGFINSTLSEFSVQDYPEAINNNQRKVIETCRYYGMRNPPSHPQKYERTIDFWYLFSIKAVFFIILENVCLLLSLFLGYVLPEIPRNVEIMLESDQRALRKMRQA